MLENRYKSSGRGGKEPSPCIWFQTPSAIDQCSRPQDVGRTTPTTRQQGGLFLIFLFTNNFGFVLYILYLL